MQSLKNRYFNDLPDLTPLELESRPLLLRLQEEHLQRLVAMRNEALKEQLVERLAQLGYPFKDDVEFDEFCRQRITRVDWGNHTVHLRLDYISEQEPGTLLVKYSERVTVAYDRDNPMLCTMTIGE